MLFIPYNIQYVYLIKNEINLYTKNTILSEILYKLHLTKILAHDKI